MGKLHLPKRERNTRDKRRHVKLRNNPPNPLRQFQKARLELVEPNIKRALIKDDKSEYT